MFSATGLLIICLILGYGLTLIVILTGSVHKKWIFILLLIPYCGLLIIPYMIIYMCIFIVREIYLSLKDAWEELK
jgi:hypothetical protein